MRNFVLAADLMEQAAKEMGDAYSNKRKLVHSGPNEGPIQVQDRPDLSQMSPAARKKYRRALELVFRS